MAPHRHTGSRQFGSLSHLAGRFAGSLLPGGPKPEDERWAGEHLLAGERTLWERMSGADRRHAVGVARRAVAALGPAGHGAASREFVAAALLHDVGKVEAGLGTFARSGVTLAAMAVGRESLLGLGRVGTYLSHDRVGADLLSAAGSDPFTVAWAREHHLPADQWSVDAGLGRTLKAADDD